MATLDGDVVKDVIDVVLATIDVDDGKPSRPTRASAKYYRTFTWKDRSAAILYYLYPLLGNTVWTQKPPVAYLAFTIQHSQTGLQTPRTIQNGSLFWRT
ncbi:hypothetical protein ON010_g4832 [Phytophthora cinnamomi]|nr:hypothetical protein ON010_g4832 [Phytophthora cinnamomi]